MRSGRRSFEKGGRHLHPFLVSVRSLRRPREDLVGRLLSLHASIPKWNFFRYGVLPPALAPFGVVLERMLIGAFTTVLEDKGGVRWIEIGGWRTTG
jgi:hypothetical protein